MQLPGSKTVLEVALMLKTSKARVLQLIKDKQLKAINISEGLIRPRWAIMDEHIEEYVNRYRGSVEVPEVVGVVEEFF